MMTTPEEHAIAQWMLLQYQQHKRLVQSTIARMIREQYGEQHVYMNKNHNWAISKGILEEFRKLTPEDVVWSRSTQTWRQRRPFDPPGQRMVR